MPVPEDERTPPPSVAELEELARAIADVRRVAGIAREVGGCPWCGTPTVPGGACRAHARLERLFQQVAWGRGG